MNEVWLVGTLVAVLAPLLALAVAVRLWTGGHRSAGLLALAGIALAMSWPPLALYGLDALDFGSSTAGWAMSIAAGALCISGNAALARAGDLAAPGATPSALRTYATWTAAALATEAACALAYNAVLWTLNPGNAATLGIVATVTYALTTFFAMVALGWCGGAGVLLGARAAFLGGSTRPA